MPGNRRSDRRRGPGQDDRNVMRYISEAPPPNRDRTDARAERTAVFGKTKMCKFFILGVCAKGSNCVFAHDAGEMNELPNLSRTKICKTLINTGLCDDPECTYAHNKEEIRFVEGVLPQLPPETRPQHAGSSGHAHGHPSRHAMGGGGGGQQAVSNAAAAGHSFNAMAGVPSMPSMPIMPGMPNMMGMPTMIQNMDPAAQAMALQQWMQMLQIQQMVMAAQSQETKARVGAEGYGMQGQTQGAASGQSFLYNALFSSQQGNTATDHPAYQSMVLPEPKVAGASTPKKGRNAAKARDVPDMATCAACGRAYPSDAKYCRSCGQQRPAGSNQRPATVPFKIKNTFIDGVVDGNTPTSTPLGGMRKAQSAAAGLYSFAGDQDDGSPLGAVETDASSGSFGANAASAPSFPGKLSQRVNTWASDLDALAEEEAEDAIRMHGQMVTAHGAASSSSQKRVQDTPFGAGQVVADSAHADPIASDAANPLEGRGETRRKGAGSFDEREGWDNNVVIKNTFIEFKHEPLSGMRQVQTAAGRLDLMCQE